MLLKLRQDISRPEGFTIGSEAIELLKRAYFTIKSIAYCQRAISQ